MEFLKQNFLNTTTQLKVDAATDTASRLFDRKKTPRWAITGYTTDTSSVISVEFSAAQVVSNIMLQNHNFKGFRAFYNSVTANSLFTVTGNSDSSTFHAFSSVTVNSIQIQVDTGQATDTAKAIGELIISEQRLNFERPPSHKDWKPRLEPKQAVHKLFDGGTKIINFSTKFRADLQWKHLTETFKEDLEALHAEYGTWYFVPFGTTTAWDGDAWEVVWEGEFDFRPDDNAKGGYGGKMKLRQTGGG